MMVLSPENRLLVACIQAGVSESAQKQIQDIFQFPIQWDEFLASANWHSVTPLVYANLKDMPEGLRVPAQIMEQLKAAYYATLARNMLLYSELNNVLESFLHAGIEVILLKGSALAKTVYSDIGMRPMGDLDVLVKQEDLLKAEEILSSLGYHFHGGNSPEWWRENYCHIGYVRPEQSVMIELHWHITCKTDSERIRHPDSGILEGLWERACRREPFGEKVRVLSPEDALNHLCIHFLKHRFPYANNGIFTSKGALRQISDIIHLLKQCEDEIDWEAAAIGKGLEGKDSLIAFVVSLIRNITGDDIASGYRRDCYRAGSTDQEVLELMAKKIFVRDRLREGADRFVIDSLSEETLQGKARKFFGAVFPSPDVISLKYSVPLSSKKLYLYYLRRPFDLFLKHRESISEIPRMKDDVILNRWIHSSGCTSDSASGNEMQRCRKPIRNSGSAARQ